MRSRTFTATSWAAAAAALLVTTSFAPTAFAQDEPDDDVDAMVRRADTALYAAKKHGRDRVCVEVAPEQ